MTSIVQVVFTGCIQTTVLIVCKALKITILLNNLLRQKLNVSIIISEIKLI